MMKKRGCAIPFFIDYMHFYQSGWGSGGCKSMVFTVRIEGGTFLGVRESGAYIVFYRSDSTLVKLYKSNKKK